MRSAFVVGTNLNEVGALRWSLSVCVLSVRSIRIISRYGSSRAPQRVIPTSGHAPALERSCTAREVEARRAASSNIEHDPAQRR